VLHNLTLLLGIVGMCSFVVVVVNLFFLLYSSDVLAHAFDVCQ